MAAKQEIIELKANEEEVYAFNGYFYNSEEGLQECSFEYIHEKIYHEICHVINNCNYLSLYKRKSNAHFPKYKLDVQSEALLDAIEIFYFWTFEDLNHFLNTNGFYKLFLMQFKGQ